MRISADNISFGYGARTILDGVSITVEEGELYGLVGANGAGKSTLLRCLHGLLRPRPGRVIIGSGEKSREIARCSRAELATIIGVVPQACHPSFPVSVAHFVGLGRFAREGLLGWSSAEDRGIVHACLEELDLLALADRSVDELSGGEFRRVLIAQALAQQPRILLFDEPVQQLDLRHQLEVMAFARAFTRRGGTSGVVVLHDLGLAARYCDRIALLHRGKILAAGAPRAVLTPAHLRTAYGIEAVVRDCPETGAVEVVALGPAAAAR
jgi:iron complex transport system ATP-binding protein